MSDRQLNSLHEIERQYSSMSDVEKRIGDYILSSPEKVINMNIRTFARESEVSEGSIINFSNKIGFSGFARLKINIAQHMASQGDVVSFSADEGNGPKHTMNNMIQSAIYSFQKSFNVINEDMLRDVANALMHTPKRIEIYGVGSSAMVANDAYYRLMRIGLPAYAVTDPHINTVSASMLDEGCIALGISHTGRTRETLRAMEIAKDKKALTICITSYAKCPLVDLSDHAIVVVAKEAEVYQEAVSARLTQMLIIDSICQYIEECKGESALELRSNIIEIIGEHRD